MTRLGWGWGDYWGALCIGVALLAAKMGDLAGWWIFVILAGVFGYVTLNILQRRIEAIELREVYDQERDQ